MSDSSLQFENVCKTFGEGNNARAIVKNVSFSVKDGEFFSILGPSGCGKTTLLRMISGLEHPTSGRVLIDGQVMNNVHPHKRNVHMVFQKYALFPHLNVFENVAFGLTMKKIKSSEIKDRVMKMLAMVKLDHYSERPIQKLSGGEQQRVALVRALVNEPEILLLDEPLGALDQKLREEMQVELTAIQKALKTTFIFVTHDQNEALTLSDRIAIMNKGKIEQIGTPTEVYENPASSFVAQFVGTGNMFQGKILEEVPNLNNSPSLYKVATDKFGIIVAKTNEENGHRPKIGSHCRIMVRPEKIRIRVTGPDSNQPHLNSFKGTLTERIYSGPTTNIKLNIGDQPLLAMVANQTAQRMPQLKLNEKYFAVWDATDCTILKEAETT